MVLWSKKYTHKTSFISQNGLDLYKKKQHILRKFFLRTLPLNMLTERPILTAVSIVLDSDLEVFFEFPSGPRKSFPYFFAIISTIIF